MDLAVPYGFDARARTATTGRSVHLRDLIEAVLFTSPGERVNRPDFGCGLKDLLFQGNSEALAATTELTVQASLQRWLGELIEVQRVAVRTDDSALIVEIEYLVRQSGAAEAQAFEVGDGR